jgi:hypothetical protein
MVPYGFPTNGLPAGGPNPYDPLKVTNLADQLNPQEAALNYSGGSLLNMSDPAAIVNRGKIGNWLVKSGVPEGWIGEPWAQGNLVGIGSAIGAVPAGALVKQLSHSNTAGETTTDVLGGVGTGVMLGSTLGVPGAIAGGLLGGGLGLYRGLTHHAAKPADPLGEGTDLLGAYGVDPHTIDIVKNQYNALAETSDKAAQQWLTGLVGEAQSQFQQNMDPIAQAQKERESQQNLVMQQLAGQAMAPYVTDMHNNLDASAQVLNAGLANFSPQMRAQVKPLISQYVNMSKNIADAYALQAQAFPIENQLAKSSWANMIAQQSGGGGGSLTQALLAQAMPSQTSTG